MRRSSRNVSSSKSDALADLARLKAANRVSRTDYEIQEEAPVYDQVDEQTYAEIAARKRKEAREFITNPASDSEQDDLDDQFLLEEEQSLLRPARKRRITAVKARPQVRKPIKRISGAFFNARAAPSEHTLPNQQISSAAASKPVLDFGKIGQELEAHHLAPAARRKRKAAAQRRVGDLLFDPPAQLKPLVELEEPHVDEYAAPPPSTTTKTENDTPKMEPAAPCEDSMDADALLAAVAAAEKPAKKEGLSIAPAPMETKPDIRPMPASSHPTSAPRPTHVERVAQNAPLIREANGDVKMFWTDAHEVRVNGGQDLYLFGKAAVKAESPTPVYASVCVLVRCVERTLYILPRSHKTDAAGKKTGQPVNLFPDVHAEITERLLGHAGGGIGSRGTSNFPKAIKAKEVVRSCPFGDADAPREPTQYLKVKFPYANVNGLEPDSYGKTFKRVFGCKTSASEYLCLKKKLKGPSWITISDATPLQAKVSHARHSLSIPSPDNISIAVDMANTDPPPLSALCLNSKTVLNPRTGVHELVMLSGVFIRHVPLSGPLPETALDVGGPDGTRDFVLVRTPDGQSIPFGFSDRARSVFARGGGVEVVPNEPALLNNFLTKLLRLDPDVILGHDILGFGLDVLISRMSVRRSREWSRLGRLVQRRDLKQVVKNNTSTSWFKSEAVAGRLVVDTYAQAKELLMREKDYSLSALSNNVLRASVQKGSPSVAIPVGTDVTLVPRAFESTESLCRLVSECTQEARTCGRLAAHLSILPLSRQLTCISGNIWSHTLRGARAERIEYLLCHEFKLIGSKSAGTASKAGDVHAKLLIPDKLGKVDRSKIQLAFDRQKAANVKPVPKKVDTGAGFGGGFDNPDVANGAGAGEKPKGGAPGKGKSTRRKPQYSGGLVLDPKKGFYDRYVLQLDFNSLYPSIIQEFNICFTTLDLGLKQAEENPSGSADGGIPEAAAGMLPLPNSSALEGVLPRVLRRLVQQRRQVKALLKEERQRSGTETVRAQQLDTRQLAIKLTANSLYGCLGFEASRFFARPLAEMVTSQGRDTLQKTVDLARESFNAQVIYGDTDSLFVYTGLDDLTRVKKLGTELKRDVNKKYRTLEIEIDAIYKKMLLLKKKKYAALKIVDPSNPDKVVREVKGLDLVRHDWCDLSHDASEHFLTQIFHGQASNIDDAVSNIVSFLNNLAANVNGNQVALSKYVITRSITKRPQDYPDAKSLPHVAVALRLMNEHKKRLKPGDYIKYVICNQKGGGSSRHSNDGVATRAYHPDEVIASKGELVIDVKYYLENQVLPPIMRLCDPVESIEASRIAVALGLDGRRYEKREYDTHGDGNYLALGSQSAADKFRDADRLEVVCGKCGAKTEFFGVVFGASGKAVKSTGMQCTKCQERYSTAVLLNSITVAIRTWISKYYTTPLTLNGDDGSRERRTRNIALGGNGASARRKFNEAWLYKQLRYLQYLMHIESRWNEVRAAEDLKMPVSRADIDVYDVLLRRVDRALDTNSYRFIDISQFLLPLGIA